MIYIYFRDIVRCIKEVYYENTTVKRVCNGILVAVTLLSVFSLATFILTVEKNVEKARTASIHYRYWLEQLPPEHPLKQDIDGLNILYEIPSNLGIVAGALIDTQEEMIKYEFSKLDISELGVMESYINKKFDELKPKYLLLDAETTRPLKKIKLKKGETTSVNLYRNGEKLSFDYIAPENMWTYNKDLKLHELISLGFVKAYIENSDIAKISGNQITAVTKGKTKLVLIYGTQLIDCDIIIK